MEEKSPVKIPPKEEDMNMSSSSSPPPKETGNTGKSRCRKTKQTHNTICVGHHYVQTNTNNPGRPRKRKFEDEDEQGNKKLKEGTYREEPKKKRGRPKAVPGGPPRVKKIGTKTRSSKQSSERMDKHVLRDNGDVLKLYIGDMVEIARLGFEHWGIYIGHGNIVHLTGVDRKKIATDSSMSNVLTASGSGSNLACVKIDNIWDVAGKSTVKKNNSKDKTMTACPRRVIKKRALSMRGPASYNVLQKNCEHFASLCRYGRAVSYQVDDAKTMLGRCCGAALSFFAGAKLVLTERAYMSFKDIVIALSGNGSMSNGTSCIDASVWHNIMKNGTSCIGASVCPFLLPEIKKRALSEIGHSSLLSNCTHFADWYRNVANFSEQALPLVVALGVCCVVGKLGHGALTRGKDKKSQKQ